VPLKTRDDVLVDSSFVYALLDKDDKYHAAATKFALTLKQRQIVVDVALTEVAQLLQEISEQAVLQFFDLMAGSNYQLEPITKIDLNRARQIKVTYSTARLDFVDCCIMAVSERLNIKQVCTFDRRDFTILRPTHCDYLELLP